MKNLVLFALVLAGIAGGIWKFYWVPLQEKEKPELTAPVKAEENIAKAEYAKKVEKFQKLEPIKQVEANAEIKTETEKTNILNASQNIDELKNSYNQKQEEIKKLKTESNRYFSALQDWDKKNPYEVDLIKEYQDRANAARNSIIENAKLIETKKQALTIAQNEHRKEGGMLRTGRTAKAAIGWRYMSDPEGTVNQLPVPSKNLKGPTILVYPKDTRAQDAQTVVQRKIDAIQKELNIITAQYNSQKEELMKVKDAYKNALCGKAKELKSHLEKLTEETVSIKEKIDSMNPSLAVK